MISWEVVGFLPGIEVARRGSGVRKILKSVRRGIYEAVKSLVNDFTRDQIVEWITGARGGVSSHHGVLMVGCWRW